MDTNRTTVFAGLGKIGMKEKSIHIRNIVIITFIYFLAHGFILVATGTWWDEKTWAFSSTEEMWNVSLQLGKPSTYFLMKFIFDVPEFVARFLIFLCFYLSSLGMYLIYNQIPVINEYNAMMMTLFYIVIPANDARIMRGVFPYTVGYTFFIIAFCGLIFLQKKYKYRNLFFKLLVLFLFYCSFILNSNLVFYALPLLFILVYIIENKMYNEVYKYIDFIVLPLIFYVIKNENFPPYGIYEGYNGLTLDSLIYGFIETIVISFERLKDILKCWMVYVQESILILVVVLFILGLIYFIRWSKLKCKIRFQAYNVGMKSRIILFLIGIVAMYLGAYAYVAIGQSCILTGVAGRSSILLGIGSAIIIYSIILWIPSERIRALVCIIAVLCGVLHFNSYYLSYQQDTYRQQDLVHEMKENKELLEKTKNVLYITSTEPKVEATRFYTLNSNGREAFGDETHFIMNGLGDLMYLEGGSLYSMEQFVYEGDYQMDDYEIGRSVDIEAIIVYDNYISLKEVFRQKIKEIFKYKKFEEDLYREKNLIVFTPEMDGFNEIILK